MQRTWLPATLLVVLFLLGLILLNGTLIVLSLPFLIHLGAGLLGTPPPAQLHIVRRLSSSRVAQDEPIMVTVEVTSAGQRLDRVMIRDLLPDGMELIDGVHTLLTALAPGSTVALQYTLRGSRGVHRVESVHVGVADQLGLIRKDLMLPAPAEIVVLPWVPRLRRIEIRPRQTRVYAGTIPARQGGPGVEFFGLRDYQPGDSQRWINARASARHPEALVVNAFEQERVADVGLILDSRKRSDLVTSGGALFEHAVMATAALADTFLRDGNRVGLAIYADAVNWTVPGYGNLQRERILRRLAAVRTADREEFTGLEMLPPQLFPRHSHLVVISPLLTEDLESLLRLQALRYHLLVVSPDPVSFEREALPASPAVDLATRVATVERKLLLAQLRQAGVTVVDWQVRDPLAMALRRTPLGPQARVGARLPGLGGQP